MADSAVAESAVIGTTSVHWRLSDPLQGARGRWPSQPPSTPGGDSLGPSRHTIDHCAFLKSASSRLQDPAGVVSCKFFAVRLISCVSIKRLFIEIGVSAVLSFGLNPVIRLSNS